MDIVSSKPSWIVCNVARGNHTVQIRCDGPFFYINVERKFNTLWLIWSSKSIIDARRDRLLYCGIIKRVVMRLRVGVGYCCQVYYESRRKSKLACLMNQHACQYSHSFLLFSQRLIDGMYLALSPGVYL